MSPFVELGRCSLALVKDGFRVPLQSAFSFGDGTMKVFRKRIRNDLEQLVDLDQNLLVDPVMLL